MDSADIARHGFHPCADPMRQLFAGREDVHGYWMPDGTIGKSDKPLSIYIYDCHLRGERGLGVYTARKDNTCWWGCVDIDIDDIVTAVNIQTALAAKNVTAWTERTRRGWHVWVFTAEPCPLPIMRRALQAACSVVGYSPKEVNPKQELLTAERPLGNWVRLPYFDVENATERIIVTVDRTTGEITPLTLDTFIDTALAARTAVSALEPLAAKYTPPTHDTRIIVNDKLGDIEPLLRRLNNLTYVIYRDGPLVGSDRSSTLVKLTHRLIEHGFTTDETFAVLKAADQRWGKYHGRPDCDARLAEIIERALACPPSFRP